MNIGERILRALKMRGMTQKELSNKLGINSSTLGGYITGSKVPDFDKLKEIACVLNVSTDYLLSMDISDNERDEMWLISKFKNFNDEQKHAALEGFKNLESYGRWK
jgi:transcriptional regulator with XRE-family HTH domain